MGKKNLHSVANRIRRTARENGADLVGFADMRRLRGFFSYTDKLIKDYPFGVCIGVSLEKWGRYDNSAEDDYSYPLLRRIAGEVKKEIERQGFSARAIPPDRRVGPRSPLYWKGEVSHKAAAKIAGLGWTGRSTLLITPELGPRVCLVTVMTDMPLPTGKPMKNNCGSCKMCVISCPLGALRGASFADHPKNVATAVNVRTCGDLVNRTWADGSMCYECMLACPIGKHKKKRKKERV